MDTADLTLKMLVEIRDGLTGVNDRLTSVEGGMTDLRADMNTQFAEVRSDLHRLDIRLSETQLDVNRIQARLTRMDLVHRTRMDELEPAYFEVREIDARVARCEAEVAALKAARPTPG